VNFVDVPGAAATTCTLKPAELADTGAIFRVDVRAGSDATVPATIGTDTLLLSSMPAPSLRRANSTKPTGT
jgi:hypothetical protein